MAPPAKKLAPPRGPGVKNPFSPEILVNHLFRKIVSNPNIQAFEKEIKIRGWVLLKGGIEKE